MRKAEEHKARLLALLEQEQQRPARDLEQKFLPAPQPQPDPPQRYHRLWIVLLVLIMAIAALIWNRTSAYWPFG